MFMKKFTIFFCLFLFFQILVNGQPVNTGATEARLLRFPDICGDQIVFSCAGDLYIVSADGGVARKLTSNIGYEMFLEIFT
jgi:tricorn protease